MIGVNAPPMIGLKAPVSEGLLSQEFRLGGEQHIATGSGSEASEDLRDVAFAYVAGRGNEDNIRQFASY